MPHWLHDLNITISEFFSLLVFLGGLVGIWITVRLKMSKNETAIANLELNTTKSIESLRIEHTTAIATLRNEVDIELKSMDSKIAGQYQFFGVRVTEFVDGNNRQHDDIKDAVNKTNDLILKLTSEIGELKGAQHVKA